MFDELDVMKNYTGQVLLLEEDYYLAPDIITTLQMTLNLKKKSVPPLTGLALVTIFNSSVAIAADAVFFKNSFSFNQTSCFESYMKMCNYSAEMLKKCNYTGKDGIYKKTKKQC